MVENKLISRIRNQIQRTLDAEMKVYDAGVAHPTLSEADRRLIIEEPVRIHSIFDHTALSLGTSVQDIEKLCREAIRYRFFSVCVHPIHVKIAADVLSGSDIKVISVAGFPLAGTHSREKAVEAERAIKDGATEIDMVMNVSALKAGDLKTVKNDIETVKSICGNSVGLKVIIETGVLTDEEKIEACLVTMLGGADFVKTSTGFGPSGAKVPDVKLMRRVVRDKIGVKASAGIRDLQTALAMVGAGADRIGCSASVRIIREARGEG